MALMENLKATAPCQPLNQKITTSMELKLATKHQPQRWKMMEKSALTRSTRLKAARRHLN